MASEIGGIRSGEQQILAISSASGGSGHFKGLDVEFDVRLRQTHGDALTKGLWKGTGAARDRVEYWAAGVEAYFDAAGDGQPPHGADRPVTTREALKAYDPDLYALVDETMAYREHVDWRYKRPAPRE